MHKNSLCGHRGSKPASKSLKTTAEQMRITHNKFCPISSSLARSMADLVSKNDRFGAESSRRLAVCHVGVSNEGRSSSIAIGLSNDCKWVFNQASSNPWWHAVVHFEVKMSRF